MRKRNALTKKFNLLKVTKGLTIPKWYTKADFKKSIDTIVNVGKLQAVKDIYEKSKVFDGEKRIGLKEAKEIIDQISAFDIKPEPVVIIDQVVTKPIPAESYLQTVLRRSNLARNPYWFDNAILAVVLEFQRKDEKLQACKFLTEMSKEKGTRTDDIFNFGLKEAKTICDIIWTDKAPKVEYDANLSQKVAMTISENFRFGRTQILGALEQLLREVSPEKLQEFYFKNKQF